MQARNKVAIMQEVMRVWHQAIPPQLRSLLLTVFDLQLVPTDAALATPRLPGSLADADASVQGAAVPAAGGGGGGAPRETCAATDGDDADDGSQAGGEEEAEDRELSGGAFVLGADGTASPWRTLGALAIRAALGGANGGRASVWEEARRGLQGARLSRPGVLSLVQEASSAEYPTDTDAVPTDDDAWHAATPLVSPAEAAPLAVRVRPTADACADPLMMSYHPDMPPWLKKPDFAPADVPQAQPAPPTPVRGGAAASRQPPPPPTAEKKPPPLPPHWHEATDGAGQVYYYNDRTNSTSWQRPAGQNHLGSVSAAAAPGRPSSARPGRPPAAARSGVIDTGRPTSAGPKPPAARGVKSTGAKRDPPFR